MNFPAVYFITNLDNGMTYVGSTSEPNKRMKRHLYDLRRGRHHNRLLQSDYDSGDLFDFTFYLCKDIEDAREAELIEIERALKNGDAYNISLGSIGGDNLTMNPNRGDIIRRITASINERVKNFTDEDRTRMSEMSRGENNGMYGRTHSRDTKRILSEVAKRNWKTGKFKGHPLTEEHRRSLSIAASHRTGDLNPFFGHKHNEETKRRIREANTGRLPVNAKAVIINGVRYSSPREASDSLGIPTVTIRFRCGSKNPKFANYRFE